MPSEGNEMEKKYHIYLDGSELELLQTKKGIKVKEQLFNPEIIFNGKFYRVFVNGKEFKVEFKEDAVFLNGKEVDFDFRLAPEISDKKGLLRSKRKAAVRAAIPGKIIEIKVAVGEQVKDQQCLLVLESMKMRNEILAPIPGTIEKITVSEGDQVATKQLLLSIKNL